MSKVFDAISQAEEFRVAELRAQASRIIESSGPADSSSITSSETAAASDERGPFEDVLMDHAAELESSQFENDIPAESPRNVASIVEYAPPAPSDETRRRLQASLASAIEALVLAECRRLDEQKLRHHMRDAWSKESLKFSSLLDQEFHHLLAKAAARHDIMSNQLAKKFCDSLHEQMSVAVSALGSWIERKREALELEFQQAFSRFSQQAGELVEGNIANQQRESRAMSAELSSRLQRAAQALEQAGLLTPAAD